MKELVVMSAFAMLLFSVCSVFGRERALIYPAVIDTASNMVAAGDWTYPAGDSERFVAERRKGGPFSDDAPAWWLKMQAPEGAYWRHHANVRKGRTYLMGAWVRVDNTTVAIRGYGRAVAGAHNIDKRVYFYGGFNACLKPYMSVRMLEMLSGDPMEWKLLYRLVEYPEGVVDGTFCMAVGIYLSTGEMTFASPFFIDVTDLNDRSLAIDVDGSRPFKRLAVRVSDIGDEVWSKDFPEPVTSFKGVVPGSVADYARGLDEELIAGHALVVFYVDGTVRIVHAPQEKSCTKRR